MAKCLDLIDDLAITQGKTYQLSITYPGDFSTGVFRGTIRDDQASYGGVSLADFTFLPPSYDGVEDETTVVATLSDTDTASIFPTRFETGDTPSINNCYVYDIELFDGSSVLPIINLSYVQVNGEATI